MASYFSDAKANMIQCSGQRNCPYGGWVHAECFNLDEVPNEDWWCGITCQPYSKYCKCKQHLPEEQLDMIGCSSEDRCIGSEWFHKKCIGFLDIPGKYICPFTYVHLFSAATIK
jgi:hypothetical protein